jgi:hypothetical protein
MFTPTKNIRGLCKLYQEVGYHKCGKERKPRWIFKYAVNMLWFLIIAVYKNSHIKTCVSNVMFHVLKTKHNIKNTRMYSEFGTRRKNDIMQKC